MQPCREGMQAAAGQKFDLLKGIGELKGLLILYEALHLFIPVKFQRGERGKEQSYSWA